jgi:hypothetical protein
MEIVKRETSDNSKPTEAFAVTHHNRRGTHRGGRHSSNSRWQGQTQQNNWKKRQNVFCDFHNSSTHSSEECRNHPKNKRQKTDQHAKVSFLEPEEETDHSYHTTEDSTKSSEDICEWYADSGATRHMSGNVKLFSKLEKVTKSWIVKGVGGKRLYVEGTGDVYFRKHIDGKFYTGVLKNVLYVPNLGVNLVSIGWATEKDSVKILFLENEVLFSKHGRLSIKGKKVTNGLYQLDITAIPELEYNALAVRQTAPLTTWHERLGHVAVKTVQTMATRNLVDGLNLDDTSTTTVCSGCMHGKMHRRPFSKGRKRAKRTGELIHADLCGPMQIVSPGGMKYFLTFKDDATCYTELYFLRSKDEAFSKFKGLTYLLIHLSNINSFVYLFFSH